MPAASAGLEAFIFANADRVSGKEGGVAGVLVGTHCCIWRQAQKKTGYQQSKVSVVNGVSATAAT